MLLTAFAATVVIVSWIADPTPGPGPAAAPAHDTQLVEHPLTGLGGGITVREVTQDVPFSLVALTGDLAGTSTRVRARHADGSWGPWYQTDFETGGADAVGPPGPRSTDPVFVGTTTSVQIAVTRPMDAQVTPRRPSRDRAWATNRPPRNSRSGRTSPRYSSPHRRRRPKRRGRPRPAS